MSKFNAECDPSEKSKVRFFFSIDFDGSLRGDPANPADDELGFYKF